MPRTGGGAEVLDPITGLTAGVIDLATRDALAVALVNGSGDQITSFGGTSMVDDSAFTVGTSSVTPMGALLDDTSPDTVNEGDIGAPRMSIDRILYTRSFPGTVWTAINVPAANTQATVTRAAAGAGLINVCTGLTVMLVATATAPTAVNVQANLIDGATGGTTYLWRATISLPATAGAANGISPPNLFLPGSANTAMTLEFSGAGGANTIESVTMHGIVIAA